MPMMKKMMMRKKKKKEKKNRRRGRSLIIINHSPRSITAIHNPFQSLPFEFESSASNLHSASSPSRRAIGPLHRLQLQVSVSHSSLCFSSELCRQCDITRGRDPQRRASSLSWGSSSTLLPAPSSSLFKPPIGQLLPLLTFGDDSPPSPMASSSDDSPPSSRSSSPSADQNSENKSPLEDVADDSFWSSLARRARSVLEDGVPSQPSWEMEPDNSKRLQRKNQNIRLSSQGKWKRQDSLALHKGLEAIASSLSLLSDTLGTALEEGLNLVETKATNFMYLEPRSTCLKKSLDLLAREKLQNSPPKFLTPEKVVETSPAKVHVSSDEKSGLTRDTQLKASRDVAMAMATKAKLLLRDLKNVKADLTFTTDRCAQLEEENKRLRESVEKGVRHEEDDLVRLQLETLLAEKARLTQENAAYARENQFLHEVVQYHQLTLRNVVLPDEALMDEAAGLDMDTSLDMDFPPMYPQEIDFSALE